MRKISVTALNEFYPSANQVVTASARDKFKYGVAHYAINVSNYILSSRYNNNEDSSVIANADGWQMPIGGPDFDHKLESAVLTANKNFLVDEGVANADAVKNAVYQIMTNSRVMYSLLHAVLRSQNGMYIQDEDKVQLSPIMWRHEHKALTGLDWHINGSSWIETSNQSGYRTLAQRRSSNNVCFIFSMTNNQWDELVRDIVGNMYLTPQWRTYCEHMFSKVFYAPSRPEDSLNFVVFWPTSQILVGVNAADEDVEQALEHYDANNAIDNTATYNDLRNLVDAFVANTTALFDKYPQLDEIMEAIGATTGTTYDMSRKKSSNKLQLVIDQDIEHFIKETSVGFMFESDNDSDNPRHLKWAYSSNPGVRGTDRRFAFRSTDLTLDLDPEESTVITRFVNISYADQSVISAGYAEISKGWVAPLNACAALQWQGAGSSTSSKVYYAMPLLWIGGDWDSYFDALDTDGTGDNQYPLRQDAINSLGSFIPTLVALGIICPSIRLILKDPLANDDDDFANHLLMYYEELLEHTLDTYVITNTDAMMLQRSAADILVGAMTEGQLSFDYHTGDVDKSGDNITAFGKDKGSNKRRTRRRNRAKRGNTGK